MVIETLSQDVKEVIDQCKDKRGNLIMILHAIQNRYGYVPREASLEISRQMGQPLARIYEVITFYNYFRLTPPGKFTISVCMGTACYLKGALTLIDEIKRHLHIEEDETTQDGLFHLQTVRCLGCCGLAPVVTVGTKVYSAVKRADVPMIIAEHSNK